VLALAAFIALRLLRERPRRHLAAALRPLLAAVVAMALVMLAAAALVGAPDVGFFVSARYYVLYPLLAVGIALLRWDSGQLERIAGLVVLLALLQLPLLPLEFAEAFGPTAYAGSIDIFGLLQPRAIGTLGNPNNLSIFLALAVLLVITGAAPVPERWSLPIVAALATGLLLTFSKANAAVFLILGAAHWFERRDGRVAAAWGVGAAVAAATSFGLRTDAVLGQRGDTSADAAAEWSSDASTFLFGNGFGRFAGLDDAGDLDITVIDNMVLALGVEGGLAAVLVFAAVVAAGLWALWRSRAGGALGRAALVYGGLLLVYVPLAVVFRLVPGALAFWLLVGLAAATASTSPRAEGVGREAALVPGEQPGPAQGAERRQGQR
jgi:hypothetical protein